MRGIKGENGCPVDEENECLGVLGSCFDGGWLCFFVFVSMYFSWFSFSLFLSDYLFLNYVNSLFLTPPSSLLFVFPSHLLSSPSLLSLLLCLTTSQPHSRFTSFRHKHYGYLALWDQGSTCHTRNFVASKREFLALRVSHLFALFASNAKQEVSSWMHGKRKDTEVIYKSKREGEGTIWKGGGEIEGKIKW